MSKKNRPHPSPAAAGDELHDDETGARDEPTAADGFAPAPGLDDADEHEPVGAPVVKGESAEEGRVAKLERELAELKALLQTSAAAGTVVPPGFRLVKDEPTQDAKSIAEQTEIRAEIDKGHQRRTQEHCDRLFPEGKHVFRCVLAADKNGNPELLVRASTPTDAAARYLAACGINHTEHKVECARA